MPEEMSNYSVRHLDQINYSLGREILDKDVSVRWQHWRKPLCSSNQQHNNNNDINKKTHHSKNNKTIKQANSPQTTHDRKHYFMKKDPRIIYQCLYFCSKPEHQAHTF